MNDGDDRSGGITTRDAVVRDVVLPDGAVALTDLRAAAVEHGLGYFRSERFVIFGYCPGGGEVIWKDGHSSGFGTGGWRVFLEEIVPVAQRYGIGVGGVDSVGTHVLLIDRAQSAVYAVPRESAETFLAKINDVPLPTRPCLCALLDCRSCPVRTCPRAGRSEPFDMCPDRATPALTLGNTFNRVDRHHRRHG
jgi:hypothetical protein